MALTISRASDTSGKKLLHLANSVTDGAIHDLIQGVEGKKISIWRLMAYCASDAKSCTLLNGTIDKFHTMLTGVFKREFNYTSHDGIPVFVCNEDENFSVDPSDATTWDFYIVYSIDNTVKTIVE